MCKTQFLKYFSEESCKSCHSIQKADKCVEFDECSSHSYEYFKAGFSANQKEIEEKLLWIDKEEILPEITENGGLDEGLHYSAYVQLKVIGFDDCPVVGYYVKFDDDEFFETFAKESILQENITHWRHFL